MPVHAQAAHMSSVSHVCRQPGLYLMLILVMCKVLKTHFTHQEPVKASVTCCHYHLQFPLNCHGLFLVAVLQARLVLGVRAELDACKEALLRLYRP